jgi:hypothetical protein
MNSLRLCSPEPACTRPAFKWQAHASMAGMGGAGSRNSADLALWMRGFCRSSSAVRQRESSS